MASPHTALVVGSGVLLASPALWAGFVEGTLAADTALIRLGVAIALSWIGVSLLRSLLTGTATQGTEPVAVPLALPGTDGPVPVRGTVIGASTDAPGSSAS